MNTWQNLKNTKNFLKLLSLTIFSTLIFASVLMVQYQDKENLQLQSLAHSQSHLNIAVQQLEQMSLENKTTSGTYYLENMSGLFVSPHQNIAGALNQIQPRAIGLISSFEDLQQKQNSIKNDLNNILYNSLVKDLQSSEFKAQLYDFGIAMERNVFGKEISTSGITQLNSRLFTLEESFIREELGSEQTKGLLASMMLSTQDYILAANSFVTSKKSTLESMLFIQESLRKQQMTYASSMEGQNLVLSLLMTMLVGVLGWILFSTFRNRHYETMVSDNESSAKVSEKNLIRTEVKKLMSSVDSAWIDSAREAETLEEAKTSAKDFSNQMEHLESDINYANQQEITSVIDCRRRLEHLINSSITGSVYVTELGSIMERLQSMEQELEGNQKYLIDDVNSLENAMESVQSSLSHLDEDMKKVMADTNRAHQSTEIIEESNKIIDE
jgi:hypothetical protein